MKLAINKLYKALLIVLPTSLLAACNSGGMSNLDSTSIPAQIKAEKNIQFIYPNTDFANIPEPLKKFANAAIRLEISYDQDGKTITQNCSGINIDNTKIITAAHCLTQEEQNVKRVLKIFKITFHFIDGTSESFSNTDNSMPEILVTFDPRLVREPDNTISSFQYGDSAVLEVSHLIHKNTDIQRKDVITNNNIAKRWSLIGSNYFMEAPEYLFSVSGITNHKLLFNWFGINIENAENGIGRAFSYDYNALAQIYLPGNQYFNPGDSGSGVVLCQYDEQSNLKDCKLSGVISSDGLDEYDLPISHVSPFDANPFDA